MGKILGTYGRSEISVESKGESFVIHPSYGYDVTCPTCQGEELMGGSCVECGGKGRIGLFKDESFGRIWTETGHPEFLKADIPAIIRAISDLDECPKEIKEAIQKQIP